MSELAFAIAGVRPERFAAVPTLAFGLRISETSGADIHSILLRCQIRIEPHRRRYSHEEEGRLVEQFGAVPRWSETLKPFLWTHVSAIVPALSGSIEFQLQVPCTYDFEVTAAKYFHALDEGEIPMLLLFSGTVFAKGENGLRVSQVPWSKEIAYRLPLSVWREMADLYFPNSGWLRLRRDTLNELMKFKARHHLVSWDDVVEALLKREEAAARI
ncbi:MAG TPA: DUF6084 family protein [Candidatus Binataceae bacterium]|nr:DUF6084 family protein [Candidatus Binataceae bacterium]